MDYQIAFYVATGVTVVSLIAAIVNRVWYERADEKLNELQEKFSDYQDQCIWNEQDIERLNHELLVYRSGEKPILDYELGVVAVDSQAAVIKARDSLQAAEKYWLESKQYWIDRNKEHQKQQAENQPEKKPRRITR